MNKRLIFWKTGLLALIVLLSATACSTVVSITEYVPSQIDMAGRRVIAVASTKPYTRSIDAPRWVRVPGDWFGWSSSVVSGVDADVKDNVATYATQQMLRTLSANGYYTIIRPEITDSVLNLSQSGWGGYDALKKNGVEALLTSSVNYMDVSETLNRKPIYEYREVTENGVVKKVSVLARYDYIITQIVTLDLTYTLTDIDSGRVIATKQLIEKRTRDRAISSSSSFAPSVTPLFRDLVDEFQGTITQQLVPRSYSRTESLMDNNPKNAQAAAAYDLVSKGNLSAAYDIFRLQWDTQNHIPSGYNAALLLYARGSLEDALELMQRVYTYSGNAQAARVLSAIRTTITNRDRVNEQTN